MKIKHLYTCFVFYFLTIFSLSAQIFVDENVGGGLGDGFSWANAYTDLQSALAVANNGDQIWVANGTYYPTSGTTRTSSFVIPNGVEVYGGFQGSPTNETSLSQRNWTTNTTTLSGNINNLSVNWDNSYRVVTIPPTTLSSIVDGFFIQEGHADFSFYKYGAGININAYNTNNNAIPVFKNCTIQNNYSELEGGAVYIDGSATGSIAPQFENCIFTLNQSGGSGGAVYHNGSGGSAASTFTKCTFFDNVANKSGGAVFNHAGAGGSSSPVFIQCDFEDNTAQVDHGGAMYNLGSSAGSNSSPTIDNCRFFNNNGFAGGAIYNNGSNGGNSSPNISNSTFSGNFITGASSGGNGGAIYNNGSGGGNSSTMVMNCIVWGNTGNPAENSHVFRNVDGTPTISYSIVDVADCNALNSGPNSNVTCGAGMIFNNDPLFNDEANGDFTLDANSPAIDMGDNTANTESEDLAGNARVVNTTIDIGSFENQAGALPIELINFRVTFVEDRVELFWATLTETNNDFFTIEHSVDGDRFNEIQKIPGAGNSNTPITYREYDRTPQPGTNYYRLKQTDFDGQFSYSPIRGVEVILGKVGVFPNPVNELLNISFADFQEGEIEYAIYNFYGKEIHRSKVEIQNGFHVVHLDQAGSFLPGTYVIKVFNSKNGTYAQKFQKVWD